MKPARSRRTSSAATLLVLTAVASFAACSSDDDDPAAPTPPSAAEALKSACPGLAWATVPASAIGLPSGAATVDSAIVVAAVDQAVSGNTVTPATPDHCRVLGSIAPVDAQACGTPVIAYGRGGAAETVRGLQQNPPTGVLFEEQTVEEEEGNRFNGQLAKE